MADYHINFDLLGLKKKTKEAVAAVLPVIGAHAVRESKRNAPRSPTMKQRSATLVRKRRTKQKSNSGGLERSIAMEVTDDGVTVFITGNAEAGKYARRIHDEKGKKWWKRGAGTIAKGPQADEKFIERAVTDKKNVEMYRQKIEKAVERALHK